MAIHPSLRASLTLPAICAPMTLISGPKLVVEACKAGVVGALPVHNARGADQLDAWLRQIKRELDDHTEREIAAVGPVALNLTTARSVHEIKSDLEIAARHGVTIFITALGNPRELAERIHGQGGVIFHDVTTIPHAEKAVAAAVDGLTCIGAGGGGHSGQISPLVLIPRVREFFDGTIIMAGGVTNGAGIRAGEILGADLCYLGTRFIATREASASDDYKAMLVTETLDRLTYSPAVTGIHCNWLNASLERVGLDPSALPASTGWRNYDHLPPDTRPWRDIWSAGQGIELVRDIPTVAELVSTLREEYAAALRVPPFQEEISSLNNVGGAQQHG